MDDTVRSYFTIRARPASTRRWYTVGRFLEDSMRSAPTLGLVTIFAAALAQSPIDIKPRVKASAAAPTTETSIDRKANIRVDTTLVLIPVAVTDPMSRFVTGLDKENFKVFEDKIEQVVTQLNSSHLVI